MGSPRWPCFELQNPREVSDMSEKSRLQVEFKWENYSAAERQNERETGWYYASGFGDKERSQGMQVASRK